VRDAAPLDPTRDAARIRAMYTHPDHVRRGIGRLILDLGESAARDAGFARAMMVATLSGEPLYRAAGYEEVERITSDPVGDVRVPLIVMHKRLR
jgi:GNAT superfamily N-acetyltransferase